MVVLRRHLRIVVRYDADLPQGDHRYSAQADLSVPQIRVENGGNQKANFMRNNAEGCMHS